MLVTGGGNGIGAAVVRRFAANGDTVVIADRDGAATAELAGLLDGKHLVKCVDVAVESEVVTLFQELRGRFGHIDVLVNSAAVADTFVPRIEPLSDQIERVLDVNLTCAREAIKAICPGGVIVNLGPINSVLPFAPRQAYRAAKVRMDILTRSMAAELGPIGIRTAAVAAGYIRTPALAQLAKAGHIDLTAIRRRIPMGRMGQPEDVAHAVFFLASSDASYVNGSILCVDGGWTLFSDAGMATNSMTNI
ncbi:SDR family oxidoreductase [Mesorhizobium sp. AaZ16]|uniref:SDR family oxidoreductase n=1 Tax=Mesorhizobium sp. AaZ16 TaxID=3402289 RepID=UPI00374F34AB